MIEYTKGIYKINFYFRDKNSLQRAWCLIGDREIALSLKKIDLEDKWNIFGEITLRKNSLYWINVVVESKCHQKIIKRKLIYNNTKNIKLTNPPLVSEKILTLPFSETKSIGEKIYFDQQNEYNTQEYLAMIAGMKLKPLISILMPTYNTPVKWLQLAIDSVKKQHYPYWELCIADDHSTSESTTKFLKEIKDSDVRIKVCFSEKNCGISKTSNKALQNASGEFIALLDHDDELTADALFWVATEINKKPSVDFIYSDECKIDDSDQRKLFHFFLKPDWSPEFLLNYMYTGHLTIYRKKIIENIGKFQSQYDFSQDYDLALRISEKTSNISHIERILYLWRAIDGSAAKPGGKDFARISNLHALKDAMNRRNLKVTAVPSPYVNYPQININLKEKVSIIIPTDSYQNLKRSIDAILLKTSYPNYEIVPVCNSTLAKEIQAEYLFLDNLNVVCFDKKYNFSEKCNDGVKFATGEIIIFYNDDVFPLEKHWIDALIEFLYIDGVGGVSPKLIFENGTIQYSGMITGVPGLIGTPYNGLPNEHVDEYMSMHRAVRNTMVLSGACMALKREVFIEIGGFDPDNTPTKHSDVDLSFKLIAKGFRCVYTPHTTLIHIGNHSWGTKNNKDTSDIYLLKKWGKFISKDPYFTNSQKSAIYKDFSWNFSIHFPEILIDQQLNIDQKNILLISHEMTLTGAPRILLYAAALIRELGYFPVVMATRDGPIRKEFENAGVTVIIDESLFTGHWLVEKFMKNFDIIIANTIASYPVLLQMRKYSIPIIWWVHEGAYAFNSFLGDKKNHLNDAFIHTKSIYVINNHYCAPIIKEKYPHIDVKTLSWGLPNKTNEDITQEDITFLIIGSIEPRKGQDIFIKAILKIPCNLRMRARFKIIGGRFNHEPYKNFYNEIDLLSKQIPELEFTGLIDSEEVDKLIAKSIAIVGPSRDEPQSIAIVQGMIKSKICIVSDSTGLAFFIKNGENGFVIENENIDDLAKIMSHIIENHENIKTIGQKARKIYEENFSMGTFKQSLKETFIDLLQKK
jgi:GT2 family glycosyltransferase